MPTPGLVHVLPRRFSSSGRKAARKSPFGRLACDNKGAAPDQPRVLRLGGAEEWFWRLCGEGDGNGSKVSGFAAPLAKGDEGGGGHPCGATGR